MIVKRIFKGKNNVNEILKELLELELEKIIFQIYNNTQVGIVASRMEGDRC